MRDLLLSALTIFFCFCSCSKLADVKPSELDYYPTSKDSKWVYASDSFSGEGMLSVQASGDILVDGKSYAVIGGTNPLFSASIIVRKENGRYYGRGNSFGFYMPEFIFLQDNLPVGSSWTNTSPYGKQVCSIVSIDKKRMIGGKEYTNTIEIKTVYYQNDQLTIWYTKINIYAKGIGIVASSTDQPGQLILKEYEIK